MNYLNLIDGPSAAIVLGGTVLATVLRCGLRASLVTASCLVRTLHPRFNAAKARAALALQIQDIRRNGLLRAEPHRFGDREFDDMADTLIGQRSLGALLDKHRTHRDLRVGRSQTTVATLGQAAEMGPVFGLGGTLIALSQLPAAAAPGAMLSTSIPTAIVTTFYGLMAANLLFAPLARLIERRADREEAERQKLIDWLADELAREGMRQSTPQEQIAA
ncbi:MAG: MotA/TolQ/ExbB proton channel family protein [Novosphingobium sp.]|nr:MotA/TolQ/ExbB proton channel family protein [Novosphingobium sp.]